MRGSKNLYEWKAFERIVFSQCVYCFIVDTVNSLIATTSRKRPPPVSDRFVNNRFVSQLNTVSRALS